MTAKQIAEYCDENTIGVVPAPGVTFTLQYEPVEQISRALDEIQKKRGLDIPIHVDAASGGFIAPFLHEDVKWDFQLPRVKSINASGHKFGLTPLGCGWCVWREKSDLPEELIFNVDYLGGKATRATSRSMTSPIASASGAGRSRPTHFPRTAKTSSCSAC